MIDLHTHILPGVDDGSDSMSESLTIVEAATKQGIKKIVATPHYLEDEYHLTPAETIAKVAELQKNIDKLNLNVEILPGAEVFITADIACKLGKKEIMTVNDSRYILVELPFERIPDYTNRVFYDLKALGYIPIIAHPERYMDIIRDPNHLYYWINNKIYAQFNAGSLFGVYGSRIKETAEILVKNKLVQFIGSDLHSTGMRSKCLKKGIDRVRELSGTFADNLLKNAELAINNKEIKINEPEFYKQDSFIGKFKKLCGF